MKKVREIKQISPPPKARKKLHVAAYCRVSTDSDAQLESLDVQRSHYESLIASRPDWELVDVYYDEGISGTKASIRPGLMRMMEDCENHRIDMVLTKSLSRFARNTTDCLELVRRLQALEIPIYFEKENLNTAKMESEFFLSTYSSIAESESVSISENTKWSVQKRFQNGTYKIGYPPYGYVQVDGKLKIDPEQGEIVREIFASYLSGVGISEIVRNLNARSITTKKGRRWQVSTVVGILTNVTYTGNVIFQKTYTDSQFNRHANHGQREQYYIEDHHEALVSQEDFDRAAQLLNQHGSEKGIEKGSGKYQKRYAFSGRILCGECGGVLKRRIHSCEDGTYVAWCCCTHLKDKAECSMKFIRGDDLERAFLTMLNKLIYSRRRILVPLLNTLKNSNADNGVTRIRDLETELLQITEQRQTLQRLMAAGYLDQVIYTEQKNELMTRAAACRLEIETVQNTSGKASEQIVALQHLLSFAEHTAMQTVFDESLFAEYVDHIVILDRETAAFHLKCGLVLQERLCAYEPYTLWVSNRKRAGRH